MKAISLILVFTLLQACIATNKHSLRTESGRPEVIISKGSMTDIHDVIINEVLKTGAIIDTDRNSNIVISLPMDAARAAGQEFASSIMTGQKGYVYSDVISFSLISVSNGTRIIARLYTKKQSPRGQISINEEEDAKMDNQMQGLLNNLKLHFGD